MAAGLIALPGRSATPCPPSRVAASGGSTATTEFGLTYWSGFPPGQNPLPEGG